MDKREFNVVIRRYLGHEFVDKMNKRPMTYDRAYKMAERASAKACREFHEEMYIRAERA